MRVFSKKNPFIHGTNSSMLQVLEYTDYTMIEPVDMVEKYGVAPLTGEMGYRGAYRGFMRTSNTRFGRCRDYSYDLKKIIEEYALDIQGNLGYNDIEILQNLGKPFHGNLNLIIIYVTRCKMQGLDVSKLISQEHIESLRQTVNTLHLGYFINNIVHPKPEVIGNKNVADVVYDKFKPNYLFKKIAESNLDLGKIYDKYKQEPCKIPNDIREQIMSLLTIDKTTTVERFHNFERERIEITVDETQPFSFEKKIDYPSNVRYGQFGNIESPEFTARSFASWCLEYGLMGMLYKSIMNEKLSAEYMCLFRAELYNVLKTYERKINILESLLKRDDIPRIEPVKDTFPLILISNNDKVFRQIAGEFETVRPLKIGTDIRKCATDTQENKKKLERLFEEKQIKCKVYTFDQLKKYYKETNYNL